MALDGGCGSRTYENVGSNTIDAIIAGLTRGGATITGNNPWTVDTHDSDVVLRGTWNAATNTLQVAVLDSAFYAPCGSVWNALEERITPIIKANQPAPSQPAASVAPPVKCVAWLGLCIGTNATSVGALIELQKELARVTKSLGLTIAGNTAEWANATGIIGTATRDAVNQILAQTTSTAPVPHWQTSITTPWGVVGVATTQEVAEHATELTQYLANARKIGGVSAKRGMSTGLKLAIALGLGVGAFILIRRVSRASATAPSS